MALVQYNTRAVRKLYDALACNDLAKMATILAPDIEWRFHGPPQCHYMMQVLTGNYNNNSQNHFRFKPQSVSAVGPHQVVAEGEGKSGDYWVHVWTIEGGVITKFRENFNTKIIVKEVTTLPHCAGILWTSKLKGDQSCSLPELVLAIDA